MEGLEVPLEGVGDGVELSPEGWRKAAAIPPWTGISPAGSNPAGTGSSSPGLGSGRPAPGWEGLGAWSGPWGPEAPGPGETGPRPRPEGSMSPQGAFSSPTSPKALSYRQRAPISREPSPEGSQFPAALAESPSCHPHLPLSSFPEPYELLKQAPGDPESFRTPCWFPGQRVGGRLRAGVRVLRRPSL